MTKTPDTKAFQDDFTKDFMDSPKEVKNGYYLFKSKTDGYTMLFPVNAKISSMPYERHKDYYEAIYYGEALKHKNIAYYVKVTYENKEITKDIDVNLDLLSGSLHYKGDYKKFSSENQTYYYATDKDEVGKGEERQTYYDFFCYVKSNNTDKSVRFLYSVACADNTNKCEINRDDEEKKAKMLMKSIDFKS